MGHFEALLNAKTVSEELFEVGLKKYSPGLSEYFSESAGTGEH
jgi:hypothetical protein